MALVESRSAAHRTLTHYHPNQLEPAKYSNTLSKYIAELYNWKF